MRWGSCRFIRDTDYNPWINKRQKDTVPHFYASGVKVSELSKIIGLKIREQRQKAGINQEKLALQAEIDRSYMGRIERGEVNITVDKLYRLCTVLECEAADLLPKVAELAV